MVLVGRVRLSTKAVAEGLGARTYATNGECKSWGLHRTMLNKRRGANMIGHSAAQKQSALCEGWLLRVCVLFHVVCEALSVCNISQWRGRAYNAEPHIQCHQRTLNAPVHIHMLICSTIRKHADVACFTSLAALCLSSFRHASVDSRTTWAVLCSRV